MELEETPFSLRSLVKETSEIMRAQATRKGLALNVRVADDVPEVIRSDALKLKQILVNLISNSVKFTRVGSVALTVTVASDADATEVEMRQRMSEEAGGKDNRRLGRANVVPAGDKYAGKPMKQSSKELRRLLKSGEGNRFERAKGKEYLRFEVEDTGRRHDARRVDSNLRAVRASEPVDEPHVRRHRLRPGAVQVARGAVRRDLVRVVERGARERLFVRRRGSGRRIATAALCPTEIDTILGEGIEVVPDPPENEALIYNSYYDMTLGGGPGRGGDPGTRRTTTTTPRPPRGGKAPDHPTRTEAGAPRARPRRLFARAADATARAACGRRRRGATRRGSARREGRRGASWSWSRATPPPPPPPRRRPRRFSATRRRAASRRRRR